MVVAVMLSTNMRMLENMDRKVAIGPVNSDNDEPITLKSELIASSGTFRISFEN